ncbi:MAG TPA: valine--tRNA ligase [Candidatus Polarisedimenticolaceae bacterium]|nr:valine--tRNA ligase [Candidatus Polarisedimenticolaceae bacterium]
MEREYRPLEVEPQRSAAWEASGLFRADAGSGGEPFCMVIPPPNITGNLHMGHVLVYTLHDVIARWQRKRGRDVLWLPGTDHAGIATQMVVERELVQQGLSRLELGREAFERKAWEWKELYSGRITTMLRRLGSSCDWSRERFTLDPGLSRAVRHVFVRLYREGLIYRDRYIVNWCPRCRTALSDLETQYETATGRLYTIRYPAAAGSPGDLLVATTRPETLLGDTAVAVHPDDERYRAWIGGKVRVPLTGRDVPVVADAFVDPSFGTGAVKLTPAHDPNDFEAGRRHGLPELAVIDGDGRMTPAAGEFAGMDRFAARERVLAALREQQLLVAEQPHEHALGHCQRCGTILEPQVSLQWFVKMAPLAAPAIAAVETGRIRFVPEAWSKTYFEWMRNIHDWCISRQLWWGHRIPAWSCTQCPALVVAEEAPPCCAECGGALRQDEDVLDTWFSSALWPFSTLGWPAATQDLARYYPTSLLITGHDIIFFWVARMIMMGLHFVGEVPFREVYIHGLVRDAHGQKMSKTKGNVVEPAEVIERYGTDAVRLTMGILAAPGNDIPLAAERMEGYRAFANKLWNASRFVLLKVGDAAAAPWSTAALSRADRWILSRLAATAEQVDRALESYRFDHAADTLYHFVWHELCDWYIEWAKPELNSGEPLRVDTARSVLVRVLGDALGLLHPFMPFLTEELWSRLPGAAGLLAGSPWPQPPASWRDAGVEGEIELLQELVVRVRSLRADSGIDPARRIEVLLAAGDPATAALIDAEAERIAGLTGAAALRRVEHAPSGTLAARGVVRSVQIVLPLEGVIDFAAERARLQRDLDKVRRELESRSRKLGDAAFLERAPADVVERERRLERELSERAGRIAEHLHQLAQVSGG